MATIVTQTADNACHIQDAFRAAGRDDYPLGVYEAIFDFINYTRGGDEVYHLDVIAWCCDISETTLTDNYFDNYFDSDSDNYFDNYSDNYYDNYSDNHFEDIDDLADRLRRETTVLYVDADAGTVYHLAY